MVGLRSTGTCPADSEAQCPTSASPRLASHSLGRTISQIQEILGPYKVWIE